MAEVRSRGVFLAEGYGETPADLNPELAADTKLSDLNGATGQGVRAGVIQITDSAGPASYTVDLTSAHTVQDVIDLIAAQTGGAITASITGGTFVVSGSGNLTISEAELIRAVCATLGCPLPPILVQK